MKRKEFDINFANINLKIGFYQYADILDDLKKTFGEKLLVKEYDMTKYRKWSQIRQDKKNDVHFFTYIKSFVGIDGERYGIVGGKTNYDYPDILFDKQLENDTRICRQFLASHKEYQWSNYVIVIHHDKTTNRNEDNMQAIFLEKYVQRKYNLFDS